MQQHVRNTTDLMNPFGTREIYEKTETLLRDREKERELCHLIKISKRQIKDQPNTEDAFKNYINSNWAKTSIAKGPIEKERAGLIRAINRIGSSDRLLGINRTRSQLEGKNAEGEEEDSKVKSKINIIKDEQSYRDFLK